MDNIMSHLFSPILALVASIFEMAALALVGGFFFLAISGIIWLIGFVVEKTILTSRLGNTSNFINDKVIPAFEEFFSNRDVLIFLLLALTLYNWFAFYSGYPTLSDWFL